MCIDVYCIFMNENYSSSSLFQAKQSSLSDALPRVRRRSSSSKMTTVDSQNHKVHGGAFLASNRCTSRSWTFLPHNEHRWTLICKEKRNIPTESNGSKIATAFCEPHQEQKLGEIQSAALVHIHWNHQLLHHQRDAVNKMTALPPPAEGSEVLVVFMPLDSFRSSNSPTCPWWWSKWVGLMISLPK
jgi:hypothetical protein